MLKYANVLCITEEDLKKLTKNLPANEEIDIFNKAERLTNEYTYWYANDDYEGDKDIWNFINGEWKVNRQRKVLYMGEEKNWYDDE